MGVKSLVEQRENHAKALANGLSAIVSQLQGISEVKKVILFGSYAQGRCDLFTDLDVLVIMDSPLDFLSRSVELARKIRVGVALDLLVYTPQEFEKIKDRPFFRHISTQEKCCMRKSAREEGIRWLEQAQIDLDWATHLCE